MKYGRSLLAAAAVAGLCTTAAAGGAESGFRCESGRLVSLGDHMAEVRKKCGAPDFVTQRSEKRRVKVKHKRWVIDHVEEISEEQEVEVLLDEWTYDLGEQRFIRHVAFENARVTSTSSGGYGSKRER